MSGRIGRQNGPKPPSGWKKFTFLLRRVHLCTTSWGIFIYLLLPKLHVVKVEMLLFRLCAKDRADFCAKGRTNFPRRHITNRDGELVIYTGLRVLTDRGRSHCEDARAARSMQRGLISQR